MCSGVAVFEVRGATGAMLAARAVLGAEASTLPDARGV